MITAFQIPAEPLAQFIDHFFYYAGFNPEHTTERFLPDGEVQIVFDLTDYPKYIYDNTTLREIQSCRNVWFSGFRTEPITIPSGRESEMLIVQFKKGRVLPFLSDPMHVLTNLVVDAELVLTESILSIREQLLELASPDEKFAVLEAALIREYKDNFSHNPYVDFAVSSIVSRPDQSSIRSISDKSGYSHKHMIKMFRDNLGVTPKEFLKVVRFQKAIQLIERQKEVDWISVATDCGFYDQSHFISDFRTFSGFTPTAYIRNRGEYLNYLPIE